MLPGPLRLPSREFRSGKYRAIPTPYFLLKSKGNQREQNRIGVVAGPAVHKNATKRNFWKRQAKMTLLTLRSTGNDFLVIISPKANTLTKAQFREKLLAAAARASGLLT